MIRLVVGQDNTLRYRRWNQIHMIFNIKKLLNQNQYNRSHLIRRNSKNPKSKKYPQIRTLKEPIRSQKSSKGRKYLVIRQKSQSYQLTIGTVKNKSILMMRQLITITKILKMRQKKTYLILTTYQMLMMVGLSLKQDWQYKMANGRIADVFAVVPSE